MNEGSAFDSRQKQEILLLHSIQSGSKADTGSCPVGTEDSIPLGRSVKQIIELHIMSMLNMRGAVTSCLHTFSWRVERRIRAKISKAARFCNEGTECIATAV
jgi:hypothetical protein